MNRIKGLVMVLITCFSFSSAAWAAEETEVGIGFTTADIEEPIIVRPNNVLPLTSTKSYEPTGRLPQTGEKGQSTFMQLIGAMCLTGVFWLFLIFKFKEEDEEDEAHESTI